MSVAPAVLLVGLTVAAPSLWSALVEQDMPIDVALQRFVIILLVIGVGGSALRALFDTYAKAAPQGRRPGGDPDRRRPTAAKDNPAPPAA
jgi:hypothetical protein